MHAHTHHTIHGVLNYVWGLRGVGGMVIIHSLRTLEVGAGAADTHHENTFPCAVLKVWISIS